MPHTLRAPVRITFDELQKFLALRDEVHDLFDTKIECDCSALTHVDPFGLCVLKHWFNDLEERNVVLRLRDLRLPIELYMRRMDLFEDCELVLLDDRTGSYRRRDMKGQLIELQSIHDQDAIQTAANEIASTIVHDLPGLDFSADPDEMTPSEGERAEETLAYVFAEILLNALSHGRRRNYKHAYANIAARFYPRENLLEVAIVDNGCGLLETLLTHPKLEGELTDSKAIEIALLPRVSCNRAAELGLDNTNQGIGLTVSTRLALAADGRCGVVSGDSVHSLMPGGLVEKAVIPYWQGTGIFLQFNKGVLPKVRKADIIQALPEFRTVRKIRFDA